MEIAALAELRGMECCYCGARTATDWNVVEGGGWAGFDLIAELNNVKLKSDIVL